MQINEFIVNLAEQFNSTADSEFKGQTIFSELDEYSSITALSIIGMIDEEYGVTIKGEDIRNAKTIEDLYNIVKSKM